MNRSDMVPGTLFVGKVNGVKMEIVNTEGDSVVVRDLRTGRRFVYGIRALEKCGEAVVAR